jgi:hypothetical protein
MTIKELAREIEIIKENHLKHLQEDVQKINKKVESLDNRLWWILGILVSATVIPAVVNFVMERLPV